MRTLVELLALLVAQIIKHWKTMGLGVLGMVYTIFALGALSTVSGQAVPFPLLLIIAGALYFMLRPWK
ncbi:MAG: hypothetical protein AB1512_02930 [Thermodesulfobacteriota bacterium]